MAVSNWSNWQLGPIHTIDESGEKLTILATGKNQTITVVVPVESNEEYNFSMLVDGGGTIVIRELINSTDSDALGTPVLEVVSPIMNGHEIQETLKITNGKFVRVTISSGERGAGTYSFTNPSLVKKENVIKPFSEDINYLRGINMGNGLEAPNYEGEWGLILEDHYFTEIKNAGFNLVRIPIKWNAHSSNIAPYTINATFFNRVDHVIEQALSLGLKVIINIHHFDEIMYNPTGFKNKFLSLWSQIASRYKSKPSDLMFELLNEPKNGTIVNYWNQYIVEGISTIRSTNPTRKIVFGSAHWHDIDYLDTLQVPANDENLIATIHYYDPYAFTHQGAPSMPYMEQYIGTKWQKTESEKNEVINALDKVVVWANNNNIHVLMGEFGSIDKADMTSRALYTDFLAREAEKRNISWAYWEFGTTFGAYDQSRQQWRTELIKALIPEYQNTPDPDPVDILPNLNTWEKHSTVTFNSEEQATVSPTGQPWQHAWISVNVEPNTEYTFSVENPNNGLAYAHEVDANGNEINLVFYEETANVTETFTTRSNTRSLLIRLSSGEKTNGTYVFKNPTLVKGNILPQPVDILPNLNTWLKHPTVTFNSAEQATVSPTGQPWQHAWISVNVEPNTEYTFSVENPNNGLAYAHEVDANGNEINLVFYEETANVTETFTTNSNTRSLLIRLSSGEKISGTYIFRNPTLVKGNILPQPVDILPNLNTWERHSTVTFNSEEQATVSPTGQPWQHAWISVNVEPNTEYTFSVENPNNGLAYAHEVDANGNEINLVFYEETANVTETFTTNSNTRSLLIRLSSGEKTSGTYIFRNPTLVKGNILPTDPPPSGMQLLRVSSNGRYLITKDDGKPFFWMSDTAWTLAQEVSQSDVDIYLQNRKDKGFTVIMMNALPFGRFIPNEFGEHPLTNTSNVTAFNEVYWRRIDYIINRAESMGMYVYLLPAWGSDGINGGNQNGALLSPSTVGLAAAENNAYNYGVKLGQRYANKKNIIWALGGDTEPTRNIDARSVYRRLASGLDVGDGNADFLMTYHHAYGSSSNWFHSEEWLDFNNIQSSHIIDTPNYNLISQDYAKSPVKPTIDIEPRYEDIPSQFWENNGTGPRIRDFDVRQAVYWQLFAGAMGVSYGHNSVWQFWDGEPRDATMPDIYWKEALDRPGAYSMSHLKSLITNTARDFSKMTPDQSYITSANPNDPSYKVASVASNRMFAYVYMPYGGNVTVNLAKLSGSNAKAQWFNPRTGQYISIGNVTISGTRNFSVPANGNYGAGQTARGNDFVLVVEVI